METCDTRLIEALKYSRRTATKILRDYPDEVEDVLQTAAFHAIRNIKRFRGESKFNTWFTRIVVNDALTFLRTRQRVFVSLDNPITADNGELITLNFPDTRPGPDSQASYLELKHLVNKTISSMTPPVRIGAYHVLNGGQNNSPCEKSRKLRARKILREAIEAWRDKRLERPPGLEPGTNELRGRCSTY
jgi:RNA polymerase sigma-70 factor (ECF subfamily)